MAKLDSGAMTIGNNDNWREIFDDQNATAQAANQATADLAPIINGKRCALSVASGGFVLLRNSTITGKADGAYTAAKAIPANTDLDGSYLTAVSGGVANALNSNMTPSTRRIDNNGTVCWVTSIGKIRILSFDDDPGKIPATGLALGETFLRTYRSACKYYNGTSNVPGMLYINVDGTLYVGDLTSTNPKKDGTYIVGEIVAVVS